MTSRTSADLEKVKKYIYTENEPVTFIFTGDDITFAAGQASGYRNFMQHFEERIRWELTTDAGIAGGVRRNNFIFNTGMKGLTASKLLANFDRLIGQFNPKVVFMMLSLGDAFEHTSLVDFKKQIHALIEKTRIIDAIPVLQTHIYLLDASMLTKVTPYVTTIKDVSTEENVVLVNHFDNWSTYSDLAELFMPNGIQPNELGHLRLAKELMTLFDIGGEGYTWSINKFSDMKEHARKYIDKEILYTMKENTITVDLAQTLEGVCELERVIVQLETEDGCLLKETANVTKNITFYNINETKPFVLNMKAKVAGKDKYIYFNPVHIGIERLTEPNIPVELTALIQGSEPVTWLFSGDSITHGALHTKGYKSFAELFGERVRGELASEYPAREHDLVLNTGISGMTTRDLMENFDRWVTDHNPDVVFFSFGMNDAGNQTVPLDEFKLNLMNAVEKVRKLGAIPILQTLNTVKSADVGRHSNLQAYVDMIRKVAQEEGILLVDHFQYWKDAEDQESHIKSLWLNDNIHPNYIGTAHMAKQLFKTIGIYDPSSTISEPHYYVAPLVEELNKSPQVISSQNEIVIDVPTIVEIAGGADVVEKIKATIALGENDVAVVETRQKEGKIQFSHLPVASTYIVKVKIKVFGENKELNMKEIEVMMKAE